MTSPAEQTEVLAPGAPIGSKYEVIRVLGRGGMGVVYEARNTTTGGSVAIKLLDRNLLGVDGVVERFAREGRAAASLQSPHVARVIDADQTADGARYIVIELLDGRDLSAEVKRRGKLPIVDAAGIVLEACAGLAEAHARGWVHRDLKPANIFLARTASGGTLVKILDFGITKKLDDDADLTRTLAAVGTPSYMSPEQVRDARSVDHRADVWALGVILYRLVTGEAPFKGSSTAVAVAIAHDTPTAPHLLEPTIPPAFEAIILRALQKDVALRTPNVAVLARELAPFADRALASTALAEIRAYASNGGRVDFSAAPSSAHEEPTTIAQTASAPIEPRAPRDRTLGVVTAMIVAVAVFAAGAWASRARESSTANAPVAPSTTSIDPSPWVVPSSTTTPIASPSSSIAETVTSASASAAPLASVAPKSASHAPIKPKPTKPTPTATTATTGNPDHL